MLFLNFFGRITNREPDLFRVSGRSRACGHGLFSLSASTETQSSGQMAKVIVAFKIFNLYCLLSPQASSSRFGFHRKESFLLGLWIVGKQNLKFLHTTLAVAKI